MWSRVRSYGRCTQYCTPCTFCTLFRAKGGRGGLRFYLRSPGTLDPKTVRTNLANPANPLWLCGVHPGARNNPLPHPTPDAWGTGRATGHSLPAHDAPAEHARVLPQGPLGPPAPRGPHVGSRGRRAGHNRALRVAQTVPGGEAHRPKISDVHAGHTPEGLMDPRSRVLRSARMSPQQRVRAARASEGV